MEVWHSLLTQCAFPPPLAFPCPLPLYLPLSLPQFVAYCSCAKVQVLHSFCSFRTTQYSVYISCIYICCRCAMISVNVVFAAASVRPPSLPFSARLLVIIICTSHRHLTWLSLSSFFSPFWAQAAQAQGSRVSASSPASSHVIISNQGQERPVDVVIIVAASGSSSGSVSGSVAAALFVFVVSSCKLPLKVLKCCTWFVIKTLQSSRAAGVVWGGEGEQPFIYL